jgi:hypothetical protein
MPDDDRMPGYLGASWRKVHRCLQGRESVERSLVSQYPDVLDTAPLTPDQMINLYRSYVQEWDGLRGTPGIGGQLWQVRTAAL